MNCPSCNATDIQFCGKRNALYPAGIVAIIGLPLGMLHQISSPHEYHCNACGTDFARRTTSGKIAYVGLFILAAVFGLLFAGIAYVIIAG